VSGPTTNSLVGHDARAAHMCRTRHDCWVDWTLSAEAAAALLDLGSEYRETLNTDS
jgi:hypothetical protein